MTPIKDYALIGNCETAALINARGGIDWLCLPTFDAPSIFARLLDEEKGGDFTIQPAEEFKVTREYADDSAILHTRFETASGAVTLTDFFVIARKRGARFYDYTSLHSTRKLVRLVDWSAGGAMPMKLRVRARPDYAKRRAGWRRMSPTAFALNEAQLFSNAPLQEIEGDLKSTFIIEAGQPFFAVLDYTEKPRTPELPEIRRWLKITAAFWHQWQLFNHYRGPHRKLACRSAITLKLLSYAGTGAFVAAPTTSLPECLGGEANWDYRYTWVRDTALFLQTLFGLGYSGEATAFLNFACEQWEKKRADPSTPADGPTVDVLYPVCDNPIPPETELDHLAGYGDSRPVRIGNRAVTQFQLDNYGHLVQSFFFFKHAGGKIDARKRRMLETLTAEAIRFWERDDNGLWEGPETHAFTYGKVMCWISLERAKDLLGDRDGKIARTCEAISAQIMERGLTTLEGEKIFSARLDELSLDASSLLAFTGGFLPEFIARATRKVIEEKLASGPFLYRNEKQRKKEGAFLLCCFWRIDHLVREGHLHEAEELLEQLIAQVSPLGLLAEEIDPETGEFLGNFPQAFSHLGLIQSILNLDSAKRRKGFYALPDHKKFTRHVGRSIGWKGVLAGSFRAPRTLLLFFSRASRWRE